MDVVYRGKSLEAMGFEYIPTANDIGNDAVDFQTDWEEIASRDGGMRYGQRAQVKQFTLRFFYDEIMRWQKEKLIDLLNRRKFGNLYFEERPYAVYTAYVSEKPTFEEYIRIGADGKERLSGYATVHFQCYTPYAKFVETNWIDQMGSVPYLKRMVNETSKVIRAEDPMYSYSGLVDGEGDNIYYITQGGTYKILNPGTEYADVCIQAKGAIDSLTIYNGNTRQTCEIKDLTTAITTTANKWYEVDSLNGMCRLTNGTNTEITYLYHDYGYIKLEPANIIRGIEVVTTANSGTVQSPDGMFDEDMVGRYLYIGGEWKRIMSYTDCNTMVIENTMSTADTYLCDIATLNAVTITPSADTTIDQLRIVVTPYVR